MISVSFNSPEFLIFYPIVVLLYFLLPKRLRTPILLIASYYFYALYQLELILLILSTTLVSYIAARVIEGSERAAVRRAMLTLTLLVCLGVLFFYKYLNFFADTAMGLIKLLGGTPTPLELELVLPVGISFYTFQTLSYVIDVYRGDIPAERSFMLYALFVSFFPQLVAGPIERPTSLLPQLRCEHRFNKADFEQGAKHMLIGFFKKVAVADIIAPYVNAVYNNPEAATAPAVIIATLLFAVQIYCDFSGYTDIAIGAARIMGIRLMKNFDRPYSAKSVKEFWSRWHISLSGWFRDYLYIPLGGSRVGKCRHLFNIFIVFLLSGLWHGAEWTFVLWGAIHALYRIVGELTAKPRGVLLSRLGYTEGSSAVVFVRRSLTFILVAFAWIFFRANSIADLGSLLGALFTEWRFDNLFDTLGINTVGAITTLAVIFIMMLADRQLTYEGEDGSSVWLTDNCSYIYYIWASVLAFMLLLSSDTVSSFIYFQF